MFKKMMHPSEGWAQHDSSRLNTSYALNIMTLIHNFKEELSKQQPDFNNQTLQSATKLECERRILQRRLTVRI